MRWCSNCCSYWICGFCWIYDKGPIYFPWPPGGALPGAEDVTMGYDELTEGMLVEWLLSHRAAVELEKWEGKGKDVLFQVAVKEVERVACKMGVQGIPRSSVVVSDGKSRF